MFLEATFPSVELTPTRNVFEVSDPAAVGSRVGLRSDSPVMMMVQAKKVGTGALNKPPLQSDYATIWEQRGQAGPSWRALSGGAVKQLLKKVIHRLPATWRSRLEGYRLNRQYSFANQKFYRKLSD